jgi:transposase InsO family protein
MIIHASLGYSLCRIKVKPKEPWRNSLKELNLIIKKIRSNNGTKFKNTQVEEFLKEEIKHEFYYFYSPQQNGVVERMNETLIDMTRIVLEKYKNSDWF